MLRLVPRLLGIRSACDTNSCVAPANLLLAKDKGSSRALISDNASANSRQLESSQVPRREPLPFQC